MTTTLHLESRFTDPDDVYAALVDAHAGLSEADSRLLNAKLVLLLANHIGDPAVIAEAITVARGTQEPDPTG